jgi:hypothetical protein
MLIVNNFTVLPIQKIRVTTFKEDILIQKRGCVHIDSKGMAKQSFKIKILNWERTFNRQNIDDNTVVLVKYNEIILIGIPLFLIISLLFRGTVSAHTYGYFIFMFLYGLLFPQISLLNKVPDN